MTGEREGNVFQRASLQAVQRFANDAQTASNIGELESCITFASAEMGFDYFAIVHHVDFGHLTPDAIRLSNYPERFTAKIREGQFARDPVLRASERTNLGFVWSDVPQLITLSDRDRAYMRAAAEMGLADGFTVPYHVPGDTLGSCHFAVNRSGALPVDHLAAAQSIGAFGFEAARRLLAVDDQSTRLAPRVPLTQRQRDCLVEVARGKSDTVIAQLLGLRPRTVNEYIEGAKRRYLVSTRQQLIVRALFQSDICFAEVLA